MSDIPNPLDARAAVTEPPWIVEEHEGVLLVGPHDSGRVTEVVTSFEIGPDLPEAVNARRRELAGLIAAAPGPVWRPIDSAPRDRPVLVFAPGASDRWEGDLGDLICRCEWHPDAGFCVCELREPSHWMPLPEPPALPNTEAR